MHVHTHMNMQPYTHIFTYTHMNMHPHSHTHCLHMHVNMYPHTHTHKESGEMRAFMLLANVLLSNIHSSGGFKKKKKSIGKVLELC